MPAFEHRNVIYHHHQLEANMSLYRLAPDHTAPQPFCKLLTVLLKPYFEIKNEKLLN